MINIFILYIILLTSLIILSINIKYLIVNSKKNKLNIELSEKIHLKNNDIYFINFSLLSYKEIAKKIKACEANSESFNNISLLSKSKSSKIKKKTLLLYFVDSNDYQIDIIKKIIESKYIIKTTPNNPDYLIYNVFKCQHLNKNYSNSINLYIF